MIGGSLVNCSASMSASLSTTARRGQSTSTKRTVEFTRSVDLKVPPKKAFQVKMEGVVQSCKTSVTLPSRIEGPFRIQYPSRRNGHYYWLSQISAAQKNGHDKTNMVAIVDQGVAIDVRTNVSDL